MISNSNVTTLFTESGKLEFNSQRCEKFPFGRYVLLLMAVYCNRKHREIIIHL